MYIACGIVLCGKSNKQYNGNNDYYNYSSRGGKWMNTVKDIHRMRR